MSKAHSSASPADPQTHEKHDDDVIVVPKGSSRSRFILTALLAVLVLTTFTVSGEVIDVLTGRNRASGAYMTWKRPDGTVEQVGQSDFVLEKQRLSRTLGLMSGRNASDHDDAATAKHMLMDRLAQDAGVVVTNEEVAKLILQAFGTNETYKRRLADFRISTKEFEATLRSVMRVKRYGVLLAQGFAVPDPQAIEKTWKEVHKEYSVDAVEVSTEGFTGEATAAAPTGEALQAWFEALPEPQKAVYKRPMDVKTAAEFAWFTIDPGFTSTEKLFAKYPRPAGESPDEVARTWYEANKELLYLVPGLPAGKAREPSDFKPFEEVQEHAKTAGTAYQSLQDWFQSMNARETAGERASLYNEASELGLAYRMESTPHTLAEWDTAAMAFQGKAPVLSTFEPTTEVQKLLPEVFVDAKGLFVGRLLTREAARVPEFADYQEKVREDWIEQKKSELAIAKLESLAAKFTPMPDPYAPATTLHVETDAAKFQAAATELGLEVKTQDWFDAAAPLEGDANTPFRQFVRQSAMRYGETPGTISPPQLSGDRASVWMVRIVGQRDPDPARMTPLEFEEAKSYATMQARSEFLSSTFLSDEFMKQQYGLELESWRRAEEEKSGAPQ